MGTLRSGLWVAQTLGMGSNIGTAEDMMKRLRSAQLTESQGAFMKKNVFQEEMKMLKRSYTEGRLSIDVMDALNEADSEEKAAGSSPNPGAGGSGAGVEEPFDEQILLDSCEGRSLETGQTDGDKQRPRAICVNDSSEVCTTREPHTRTRTHRRTHSLSVAHVVPAG